MQDHSRRKLLRYCSLEIDYSPISRRHQILLPKKNHNYTKCQKLAYKSIEVVKDLSKRKLGHKYKIQFHKKSFTEKQINPDRQRYQASISVRQAEKQNRIVQQIDLKNIMKEKLTNRRRLIVNDNKPNKEDKAFHNYLHFIQNRKRQEKINAVKANKKLIVNKDPQTKAIDETKIMSYVPHERGEKKTEKKSSRRKQLANFERDVEMSSIMEINQSSFLSDGGKNILSEVNVQPSKQLKREKSKKNQALKSLERMKNIFPKGFFCL